MTSSASQQKTLDADNQTAVNLMLEKPVESASAAPTNAVNLSSAQPAPEVVGISAITVTKSVVGSNQSNYLLNIVGPSYPNGAVVPIVSGTQVITDLATGIYTLTEVSPGGGWTTTYTATTGYSTGDSAVVTLTNPITATTFGPTQITGTVYSDYNSDGLITANGTITDTGVQSVTVTVYDNLGNSIAAVTNASGRYTITPSFSGPYRVEFTDLPADFEPSRVYNGTQNGTTVQFINAASGAKNVNLGIAKPCDYCQNNPKVTFSRYESGDGSGSNSGNRAVGTIAYDHSGSVATAATFSSVGSVWGVSYDKLSKRIYTSAFLKRHVGLGPRGMDGVYVIDNNGATPTLLGGFDLEGVTASNGGTIALGSVTRSGGTDYNLNSNPAQPTIDLDAFGKVGRTGYGAIDMADGNHILWLVNLNDRTLITVDTSMITPVTGSTANVAASAAVKQYRILGTSGAAGAPLISGAPTCSAGELRPFAVKITANRGFLGAVCDASSSSTLKKSPELHAYVLSFDPANPTSFSTELDFTLDYKREPYYQMQDGTNARDGNWQRWMNTWVNADIDANGTTGGCCASFRSAPQPILSDINIMPDGSFVLGLMDRFAAQTGWANRKALSGDTSANSYGSVGDTLLAKKVGSSYVMEFGESDPGDPYPDGDGFPDPEPGYFSNDSQGNAGEFFYGDAYKGFDASHHETTLGGAAIYPGSNEIVSTALDPDQFTAQGLLWLSTQTGNRTDTWSHSTGTGNVQFFGKASGMGDVEILCDPAPIEIGNRVWWDINGDGVQDAGEPGLSGVQVRLQTPVGTINTSTDINGNYYFTREATSGNYSTTLRPNTPYTITIIGGSAGYTLTQPNVEALSGASVTSNHAISDVRDSDAILIGNIPTIYYTTGNIGENNHGLDFGFTKPATSQVGITNFAPASLGDYVWEDLNHDGQQNDGNTGVNGVAVALLDNSGNVVSTTTTFIGGPSTIPGYYTFTNLISGTYHVSFTVPTGYVATTANSGNDTSDSDGVASGNVAVTGNYVLNAGQSVPTVDQGLWRPASLGDYVWLDFNRDGVQDGGEPGMQGITVTLQTANGILTTTTNSSGYYSFTNLISSTYFVTFTAPTGYYFTPIFSSNTVSSTGTSADSNANPATGATGPIVVNAGSSNNSIDAGLILPVDLGIDKVVTPITYTQGAATNVTYLFTVTNDGPGDVTGALVTDTAPAHVTFNSWSCAIVTAGSGNVVNACGNSAGTGNIATTVTLRNGAQARFTLSATVDSSATTVITNTAQESLPAGVPQSLTNMPDQDDATVQPIGVLSLGNVVWYDNNNDGSQNNGESGIASVTLQLLNADGSAYLMNGQPVTTTTDATGHYTFTQLVSGGYKVQVLATNFANNAPLSGLYSSDDISTTVNADNNTDGDDNGPGNLSGAVTSGAITLTVGVEPTNEIGESPADANSNMTVDFGFYEPLNLGNRVWIDLDNDGQIDAGEVGIDGVTMNLYRDDDFNGIPDAGIILSDTTANGGYYLFDNLTQGGYVVEIAASNFTTGGALVGYYSSLPTALNPNIGGAGNLGIDSDDNGLNTPVSGAIRSGSITLTASGEQTSETDLESGNPGIASDDSSNLTVDFGFFQPVSVGDQVWYDYDADGLQGASGEPGVSGVKVNLFTVSGTTPVDIFGTPVAQQTTDAVGIYAFTNLAPGDYYVVFVTTTLPSGFVVTESNMGSEAFDSDADPITGQTRTTGFLQSGEEDLNLDIGIHAFVSVGNRVWYDYNHNGIQDNDIEASSGVSSVRVALFYALNNQPVLDAGNQPIYTYTNSSGLYLFDQLAPGSYRVRFDLSTLPTGYTVTVQNANSAIPSADLVDSDADPATGDTGNTPYLLGNENISDNQDMSLDMGIFGQVNIGDTVWYDMDGDGIYEPNGDDPGSTSDDEAGVANVGVTLYQVGNATAISTTTTDNNGNYLFRDQIPGDYYVVFNLNTLPSGYVVTQQNIPGDDTVDSDANPSSGQTASTGFLSNGEQDLSLDMGIYKPVVVGDRVWIDNNGNGIQDSSEITGVANVGVTLYRVGNVNPLSTTQTSSSGIYSFTNLMPGDYYVTFDTASLPVGYQITKQDVPGDNSSDSDANPTTGQTGSTGFIYSGSQDLTLDMGVWQPVTVGNFVWYDMNRNGIQDLGETGVDNVTVRLYENGNNSALLTTTTASGYYTFSNLPPSDYYAIFDLTTLPVNYVVSPANVNDPISNTVDSDANLSTGQTAPTGQIYSGQQNLTLDMGIMPLADIRIGDTVWHDINANGIQENGELGIQNVVVRLYEVGNNTVISNDITDGSGLYLFDNLPPGNYYVVFDLTTLPAGYEVSPANVGSDNSLDSDANPGTGQTEATGNLTSKQQDLDLDMGLFERASLGDLVWFDINANGVKDAGETGIQNVLVKLYQDDVYTGISHLTDINGGYFFTDLLPGNYFVEIVTPTGYRISPQDVDGNNPVSDTIDSDISPSTGRTVSTTLTSGEVDPTWDAGLYIPLSLGNFVWFDADNNGLRETAETGIAMVELELYDAFNQLVMTTTTDANGFYLFNDLTPGDYTVVIPGSNFASGQPLHTLFSSETTAANPNVGGAGNLGIDNDDNGIDSSQPLTDGIRSGTVTLSVGGEPTAESHVGPQGNGYAVDAGANLTLDFGFYEPMSLGNQVWYDSNNNGLLDNGESGINGVMVSIYRDADRNGQADGVALDNTTTSNGGYYLFDNLAAGSYIVVIDSDNFLNSGVLSNTRSSETTALDPNVGGAGNKGINSDDNGLDDTNPLVEGVRSGTIDLYPDSEPVSEENSTSGIADDDSSNLTVDFGFYEPLSLGNRVWIDLDNNGLIDAGETGVNGVIVNLYRDTNADNLPDGVAILSDTTSNNGYYLFDNLTQGGYLVEIAASNFAPGGALAGYYSSLPTALNPNIGGADSIGIDSDDNGLNTPVSGAIRSTTVTLTVGSEPVAETDSDSANSGLASDSSSNLTVDFGFFQPVTVGDTVWYDHDGDGRYEPFNGETGVPNVSVTIFDSKGNPVTDILGNAIISQTTDANGHYTFTNLLPGNYMIQFDLNTLPSGFVVTQPNAAGVSDSEDSDAAITDGTTAATGFLVSGTQFMDMDMGIYQPLSVGDTVWFDNNHNGIYEPANNELGVPGITVTLYSSATGKPMADPSNLSQPYSMATDGSGNYIFTDLPPGEYYVIFDLSSLPTGYQVTHPNMGNDDEADSDVDPTTGQSDSTGPLLSSDTDMSLDMGIYTAVAVGDRVWHDEDHDGQQQPAEPGVADIQVTLYSTATNAPVLDLSGNPLVTTTNSTGYYLFSDLPPGGYYVVFNLATLPAGYQVTTPNVGSNVSDSDADPTTGKTPASYYLDNGESNLTLDMGIWKPVSVGDRVWLDANFNGLQDGGELGVKNVSVALFNASGQATGLTTLTDANGYYTFTNLLPGDYSVVFNLNTLPIGYRPTTANVGGDDALDSDAEHTTGQTASTGFINSGSQDMTLDMGIIGPVSVGDRVWMDTNRDGVQDPGEVGAPNIQVSIFNADGTSALDMNGNTVASQLTNASGYYSFTNLLPGSYYVQFNLSTLPATYEVSEPNVGSNDAIDSDASLSTGQTGNTPFLTPGSSDPTLDMGIHKPLGVRVGDFVWEDLNGNGIQDAGEPGVSGVVAELYVMDRNSVGVSTGYTATTDVDGFYLFAELPAGEYYVVFQLDTLPTNYKVTHQDQGDDTLDSDADATSGQTATTGPLSSGTQNLTLDMGIYKPASLGDTVWADENGNGIQDAGEVGLPNVVVTLYDGNGQPTGLTTTTDANGNYLFSDLKPGEYIVEFTPPTDFVLSLANQGANDEIDTDADPATHRTPAVTLTSGENDLSVDAGMHKPAAIGNYVWNDINANGVQEAGELPIANVTVMLYNSQGVLIATTTTDANGLYGFTDLPPDTYLVEIVPPAGYKLTKPDQGTNDELDSDFAVDTHRITTTLESGESDTSWDAGLFQPGAIGNYIWNDANKNGLMDEDEAGIAGVKVELYQLIDGVKVLVATVTTNVEGSFLFTDLPPGDYIMRVIPPAGSQFTEPGKLGGFNSDVNPQGESAVIHLTVGQIDLTQGAGIVQPTADDETDEPTGPATKRVYLPIVSR